MKRKSILYKDLEVSRAKEIYDESCENILANKIILAWIMKSCMKEYKDCSIRDIADHYIEGIPEISQREVHRDETPASDPGKIRGENTEDKAVNEGIVRYDIMFRAILPQCQERVELIINIEAQKDFYPGYPLIKRGIYYGCRMISSQYGTIFTNSHYEKIQKVYSIWICFNPPEKRKNSINIYSVKEKILENEYGITMTYEEKEEVEKMCNLNCDMCYVRMSREEMEEVGRLRTMEEWTKTAEDMMKAGTLFVLLTGGEPLLYPHFRELYQKLRELGMIITINTNGTLIDEAWADFFAENKPRRINITLYGASNETYERLCHYPGGFDKAVNGIRLLRERNIDVKVNGSLAKANVDDRMKIIELGESLDAPVRIDTYMYPSVRERNHAYNNQARLDPEMAAKARVEVLQREMGEEVFAQYRKIQLDEAENTPEGEAVPGQMACRAGKSSFVVNWQGEMRSCVVLDKPSIPLRDVEFEEAWKFTKKETESLRISARCSSCKLRKVCNTCVAAAIAETGKADGVPEYLCRYTEATVRYLKETSKK